MAKIINTDSMDPTALSAWEREQVYNGLDCCLTLEIYSVIEPQLDEETSATYEFSKSLQGPVLEMRLRGCLVDQQRRQQVLEECLETIDMLESNLEKIVLDGVGMYCFNWKSPKDLHELFYNRLGIPPIMRMGKPSVDRASLEKLDAYLIARPIVAHITMMRDIFQKVKVLKQGIDPDGRIRTSYNIAGTSTGRFSSSYSEFGSGGNLQNIEESLRSILIADPGMKMAKFDAKSGESFVVGAIEWNLFKDDRYLQACESGDPHTATARICWPALGWTGNLKQDKEIAEQPYYRHYTYRFMCKKLGHGSNYGGKAQTLSAQAKLPLNVVEQFQPKYFKAFPAHLRWQEWVDNQIRKYGFLINLMGRKRYFMGRRGDDKTLRDAIAYDPQGSLADIVNRALLRIWWARDAILLFQDHDAITIQYPEELEDKIIPIILDQLHETVDLKHGRTLRIPYDCKVGWNKGEYNAKTNPDGLRDYTPGDGQRKRQPKVSILGRSVRDVSRQSRQP